MQLTRIFHLPYLLGLCGWLEREREAPYPSDFCRGRICNLSSHSPLGEVSFVLLKQPLHQPGFRGVSDTKGHHLRANFAFLTVSL